MFARSAEAAAEGAEFYEILNGDDTAQNMVKMPTGGGTA